MSETEGKAGEEDEERPHLRHPGIWFGVFLIGILIALNVGLGLTGHVIPAPRWAVDRIEARANAALGGTLTAKVGGAELIVDERFVPHVRIKAVELFGRGGARLALLPDLRTTLKAGPILRGKLEPRTLSIYGAQIAIRRRVDGQFDVDLARDGGAPVAGTAMTPADLARAVDEAFELPVLSGIEKITVEGLGLDYRDDRAGRSWIASGGWLALDQDAARLGIDLGVALEENGATQARLQLGFVSVKRSPEASLTAEIRGLSARDLAGQSAALAFLSALDAPITGTLRTGIAPDGRYLPLDGALEIGAGALRPTDGTQPVRFDRARLDLSFDPETVTLTLPDISVDGPALRVRAGAKAWLKDIEGGLPKSMVAQAAITDLRADPEGLFADPVVFSKGQLDFRLAFAPFRLDIGQLALSDGARRITLKGSARAEAKGWAAGFDIGIDRISSARLLDLWPLSAVPKTREWLAANVATSELYDVKSAFRLNPGQEPRFALGYAFRDTEVRVIRTLPPIQDGAGYATIDDYAYTLVVERGHVTPPEGGEVDMAGSVMSIPDLRVKPAPARFTLRTDSSITATLSLLDQPPFGFLKKAGRPVDLAEGRARTVAKLDFALAQKIMTEDVTYDVTSELTDVTSDKIVPNRSFASARLSLTADRSGLAIFGPVTVSGVPMDVRWHQGFAAANKGRSRVEGRMELSPRALDAFGVAIPDGAVAGKGTAEFTLELPKDAPGELNLRSDLVGLTLKIPEIGWSKPAGTSGALAVEGSLGAPPRIDRLALDAAGLAVSGSVALKGDGALEAVRLPKAKAGNWFEGGLELIGRGKGAPLGISVSSGRLDLAGAQFGKGGASSGGPLTVALDRLQVSKGIALTGFRGTFSTGGGLAGDFAGRVNGEVPVEGTVIPEGARAAIRVRAADAGAVFRAAGIFGRGLGGAMDLTLRPRGARDYDGSIAIKQIRVTGVPALAELLDAISVVGLLSQLNGPGILFGDVVGDFRLTPEAVELRNGSAVGASLGISAAGTYIHATQVLDMAGTISPVYLLNGIGQIFSKRREGLFGFNYRLRGPSTDPSVSVNPLSILTPGMFRDIFRAEPPRLGQ
ncbi:MAG: hypothetical protein KDE00_01150 [Rhodobacteraceae bacterium]|nr:hypothetical protein [Paracoccaceae bacterium]